MTLTETNTGEFSGRLPSPYPIHGEAKTTITMTGCPNSSEDETIEFSMYIDPSGVVVDANDGDAPVPGATVTLLAGESEAGPFTPVPNGSAVMSPGNRTNPFTSTSAGEFGWDTIAGYYEVEAKKEGCGTVTTPAFFVPPPQTNLTLKLHCLLKVETSSLRRLWWGSPTKRS